jgi:LPS-assembly protein
MKKRNRKRLLYTLCLASAMPLYGDDEILEIHAEQGGTLELNASRTVLNKAEIKLRNAEKGDAELRALKVTINNETGEMVAEGLASFQRQGQIWQADKLEYNYKTGVIVATDFQTGKSPFYVAGIALSADRSNQVYVATEAYVTTDDVDNPGYRVKAKDLVIVPGKYFEARNATLYLGSVPVLYWPHYRRTLDRHPNNIELTPGYRSLYGGYLLGTYNWYLNDSLGGSIHLDYRQKRGVGLGPDFNYDFGNWGKGEFKYYFANDDNPGANVTSTFPIPSERQRISFSHQVTLRTNLTAQVAVRYQSDSQIIRDFFESEYRRNVQPASFLEVNQLWSNFSLNLLAQPRVNDFYETTERLPDVKLTALRQQLGPTPLYYESDSSIGYYKHEFADNLSPHYAAWRGDTFHQILLPHNFFGWLNVTPRVGQRFTHYGESEGLGVATLEQSRAVFNTGAEISFKASRTWIDAQNKFFEVDGLRHIVEPSVNYVFVPSPNKTPRELPQFDSEIPSLRLLPLDYPDYNAIDSVDSQNVFRFGLRNRLQTKRAGEIENLVNLAVYSDWRVKPRAGQATFSDVYSDLDFQPSSSVTFTSETRYSIESSVFKLADNRINLHPNDTWSLSVGHRYFRNDPALGVISGNNLVFASLYYRMNENWGARVTHHFEARDGRMEEQQYTLYRDFRSWTGALTCRLRESRIGPSDFTIAFTFSLKAFPRFKLGNDKDTPSLLLGG